jgi:hypothetical protein
MVAVIAVMAWLFLVLVVAVPVVLVLLSLWRAKSRTDRTSYQVVVGLYAIRRRLEVAQFKTELHRDAAHLRRVLRDELQQHEPRASDNHTTERL